MQNTFQTGGEGIEYQSLRTLVPCLVDWEFTVEVRGEEVFVHGQVSEGFNKRLFCRDHSV